MAFKGKVCLAYSGGLDTSTILKWLLDQNYEVVCFLADVGQEENWDQVRSKAAAIGATKMVITDLRREFVEELCFPAVQCNAIYEGRYLLGTSLARPVIARAQMKVAAEEGCQFVSHGCTGKGNDQVRFELAFLTIDPKIKIIAPWRMPEFFERFQGRNDLLDYAASTGIPVTSTKAKPYSMDDNIAHCSYESGQLEDPSKPPPTDMWTRTDDPMTAPATPQDIQIHFEKGIPVKLTTEGKEITDSLELFIALNAIGKLHGIGRIDIVENRYVGIKSRGCYDSPAMTILRDAHLDIEGLVMDGKVRALRDQFVTHAWSEILYNGLYFSPEREFIQNSLVFSQKSVNGEVRMRCYRGNVFILGRSSETEKLYSEEESSMDSLVDFSPVDTTGFININAIRLKKYGQAKLEAGEGLGTK
ncbi:Adenylosuccinate synthetase [Pseudogymnoascus destructans]|uniref:Argininosuccinate synthase n=2 Tax=Pseudogymnoascus destructans TaxID=655981 RepID=L8FM66_PSED2|nr:Adenylosuccinate synthetase [Pseudogymnoascus destructans]ELR02025.1 argininosuccinate synthase [Pseudogymnoascus destructans 20631-21]OAF54911.1 Adenylosuccinate synthetase [Pseudogymnoascus destructans]